MGSFPERKTRGNLAERYRRGTFLFCDKLYYQIQQPT